jgi:ankyrin repeat protein
MDLDLYPAFVNDNVRCLAMRETFSLMHFFCAVLYNAPNCVRYILAKHPEYVNMLDDDENAAIHCCCYRPKTLEVLLEHGANPNLVGPNMGPDITARGYRGMSLMDICSHKRSLSHWECDMSIYDRIICLLIDHGATVHDDHVLQAREYYAARQGALKARCQAAVTGYLSLRRLTRLPRDVLRLIGSLVMRCNYKEWTQ